MELTSILAAGDVLPAMQARSKKQVLQELAAHAARATGLEERTIFDTLLQRERLGSTALGGGIAIPHGRFAGLERVRGFFARLTTPVDFEALDHQPVDLVFLLLAPEGAGTDHLKALARVSRLLRDKALLEKLRHTGERQALHALLTDTLPSRAA